MSGSAASLSARSFSLRSQLSPCLLLLVLALVCLPGAAQKKEAAKPYALIIGTVWGPDSRPVSGLKVKIRRADKHGPTWELYSDARGEFAQRVPAEETDYTVWIDGKSKKDKPLIEEKVHVVLDERVDIGLHLK